MSRILNATLNKCITAWTVGQGRLEFELDDNALFRVDAILTDDEELDVEYGFVTESDSDEQPQQSREPTQAERYTALHDTVHNVYTHTVEIAPATGALVCRGCLRENAELAQESCDE